jgi:hypothetical protein
MDGCGWGYVVCGCGCRSLFVALLLLTEVIHDISDGLLDIVDALACMREVIPI